MTTLITEGRVAADALSEEQILYPAVLLVGECIRARIGK